MAGGLLRALARLAGDLEPGLQQLELGCLAPCLEPDRGELALEHQGEDHRDHRDDEVGEEFERMHDRQVEWRCLEFDAHLDARAVAATTLLVVRTEAAEDEDRMVAQRMLVLSTESERAVVAAVGAGSPAEFDDQLA